jgi:hypothetical protein
MSFPYFSDEDRHLLQQGHIGSGGGLFTRSGSVAHPLSANWLFAIAIPKNDR